MRKFTHDYPKRPVHFGRTWFVAHGRKAKDDSRVTAKLEGADGRGPREGVELLLRNGNARTRNVWAFLFADLVGEHNGASVSYTLTVTSDDQPRQTFVRDGITVGGFGLTTITSPTVADNPQPTSFVVSGTCVGQASSATLTRGSTSIPGHQLATQDGSFAFAFGDTTPLPAGGGTWTLTVVGDTTATESGIDVENV